MKTIVDFANLIKTYLTKQDGNKNLLGSKNLCVNIAQGSGSWSGITFTVNADKSVTLSGTSTGNPTRLNLSDLGCMGNADVEAITLYKPEDIGLDITKDLYGRIGVSSPPSGVQVRIRCYDSAKTVLGELQFRSGDTRNISTSYPTTTYVNFYITVGQNIAISSPLTIYPYIYYADDIDLDTYYPYAASNIKLTKDTTGLVENSFQNGAVNLLKSILKTQVKNGVTATVYDDGTVLIDGTATAQVNFQLVEVGQIPTGYYTLSGCPTSGDFESGYSLYTRFEDQELAIDTGNGVTGLLPYSGSSINIRIPNGVTVNNKLFKPMLTLASQPNSDYAHYVPYAATNKELTNRLNGLRNFPYFYALSDYFYHIKITTEVGSGVFAKLFTSHGELYMVTTSNAFNSNTMNRQRVVENNTNETGVWTYSIDGLTININCTGHINGFIISNHPLQIEVTNTSTPETNTMHTINMAALSNS